MFYLKFHTCREHLIKNSNKNDIAVIIDVVRAGIAKDNQSLQKVLRANFYVIFNLLVSAINQMSDEILKFYLRVFFSLQNIPSNKRNFVAEMANWWYNITNEVKR